MKVALVAVDAQKIPGWVHRGLDEHGVDLVVEECLTGADLIRVAGDAEVIWVFGGSTVVREVDLADLPKCTAILRTGTGTDNIPVAEALKAGIIVATTPGAGSAAVAEHAAAMILSQLRQLTVQDRLVRDGVWDRYRAWPRYHLQGQTLGLVGFGSIARFLVNKLRGFELSVIAFDPFVDAATFASFGVTPAPLAKVLSSSRVVSLHCPLSPETHHIIGEAELRSMRSDAILINVARGPLIDEVALGRALAEGWIAAAGLDVFEQEPIAPDNPLTHLDNTVLTPHIAGYSDVFFEDSWRLSMETVIDLAEGQLPQVYMASDSSPRRANLRARRTEIAGAGHLMRATANGSAPNPT